MHSFIRHYFQIDVAMPCHTSGGSGGPGDNSLKLQEVVKASGFDTLTLLEKGPTTEKLVNTCDFH